MPADAGDCGQLQWTTLHGGGLQSTAQDSSQRRWTAVDGRGTAVHEQSLQSPVNNVVTGESLQKAM
jgi:hypothetical protein